jgi:FkbM family methyltransferase
MLRSLAPDMVLDVGANRGQFTLMVRLLYPTMPIRAYEPLHDAVVEFERIHGRKSGIELYELALGDRTGSARLHVSGQSDSSSLLPIGELQARFFPNTTEVGIENVKVTTLDSLPVHWQTARRALLKLDVQGFELNVLRGATAALRHCAFVYAECSEVPLYTGQALRMEVEGFLQLQGFSVRGRFNPSFVGGQLIQADYLFGRD